MINQNDRPRNANQAESSDWLIYLLFGFMVICREGSSFLAMSSSKDSLAVFEDRWGPAPNALNEFIAWASFVTVAYTYANSGIKLLRNTLNNRRAPDVSSNTPQHLPLYLWGIIILGILGNGWSTAFGTYGATLRNLADNSNANSTMPFPTNSTELSYSNLTQAAPSNVSAASDWQFALAIVMAIGASGYSMLYNALQAGNWREGKFKKLQRGCNIPTIYFAGLTSLSLLTWVTSAYYAADVAEKQAGFELPNIWIQIAVNGVLQSGLVVVNNFFAQLPSTENALVERFQSAPKAADQAGFRYGLNLLSFLYALSDALVCMANILQSFGNIGQFYVIAQQMGFSKDTAFWIASTIGSITSLVCFKVYWEFRTVPARDGARELIKLGLDTACGHSGAVFAMPSSEPTAFASSAQVDTPSGTPSKAKHHHGEATLFLPVAQAAGVRITAGRASSYIGEDATSTIVALGQPAAVSARQRSGYARGASGTTGSYVLTARAGDIELAGTAIEDTARPSLRQVRQRANSVQGVQGAYHLLQSQSSDEGASHFEHPHAVPEGSP
ncbi:MAG: hypothetical protein K0R66_562 [Gammaproteobacteria bacterium]|jgi:hypothetical protein|nr:hypothetical protein [Gammaproteobacteria bacterium]